MTTQPSTAARAQVARRANTPATSSGNADIRTQIQRMQETGEFARALPMNIITPERFTRVALTALNKVPQLYDCDPKTVLGALVTAAQLGLEVNTPLQQADLIPYGKECTLQIQYRGYISLARRSGLIESVVARTVYEKDHFEIAYGLEDKLIHEPVLDGDRGKVRGYYAVAKYTGGGYNFLWMSRDDVDAHRLKFSKQPNGPAWKNSFDSMGLKTVLRAMFKFMPMSVELARADAADEQVRRNTDEDAIDTPPAYDDADIVDAEVVDGVPVEDPPADMDPETGEIIPPGALS
jgi:recombination protein RecT